MNIDEVESGKWELSLISEKKKEITNEYLIGLVKHAKRAQITPYLNRYILFIDENRTIYLGLSRWHYKQRRVRARRERLQNRIDQIKRSLPDSVILRRDRKARFGKVIKFTIPEEAIKPWQ